MNSYTVPLNAEEQRHASYQGKFKWFINDLADKLEGALLAMGVFKEKQLVRMQDNKSLTEQPDPFSHGIRTTNKKELDAMYKDLDYDFPERRATISASLIPSEPLENSNRFTKPL